MLTYFLAWFPMLLIAILNGAMREAAFKKFMTDGDAHRLSTFTLLIFFSCYIWLVIRKFPPISGQQAVLIGFLWVILTLIFEFGFGRFRGTPWSVLFNEYNLLEGKLWLFIPLWLGIAPYIFFKLR